MPQAHDETDLNLLVKKKGAMHTALMCTTYVQPNEIGREPSPQETSNPTISGVADLESVCTASAHLINMWAGQCDFSGNGGGGGGAIISPMRLQTHGDPPNQIVPQQFPHLDCAQIAPGNVDLNPSRAASRCQRLAPASATAIFERGIAVLDGSRVQFRTVTDRQTMTTSS